ncbi:hypothetical protein BC941DRAFT_442265 [Chlamydoabsidia padenii]|nr:hypothetical protein BC941DRAFT_442265 [Chlamydoabsidia padenii]
MHTFGTTVYLLLVLFLIVLAMSQYQQPLTLHQTHEPLTMAPSELTSGEKFQTKAARRAEHNAIERARRESLNTKFQQLAHSLPNLQNDRRPSKGTIIERTLEFVRQTVQKEERYRNEIRELSRANRQLMRQVTSRSAILAMANNIKQQEEYSNNDDNNADDQNQDDHFDMLDYEDTNTNTDNTLSRKSSVSSFAMQSMSSLPTTIGSGSSTTTSPSLDHDASVYHQLDNNFQQKQQEYQQQQPLQIQEQHQHQQQFYYSDGFDGYTYSATTPMDPLVMMNNLPIKYEQTYPC